MKNAVIGITSIQNETVSSKLLPITKVCITNDGEFIFLENKTIELALSQTLKNLAAGKRTLILLPVEIVPTSTRKRKKTDR